MLETSLAWAAAAPNSPPDSGSGAAVALFALIVIVAAWIGLRQLIQSLRAGKARSVVGTAFADYAREALVNAAKIDGLVSDQERAAVARAVADLGAPAEEQKLLDAFAAARLSKDELVAYLGAQSRAFSREQKTALLKALLSVFVADGKFDEVEHAALIDYTAAVGFDRRTAPEILRSIARDFTRGAIT